jgi:rare lipoprotein A (peptidoglycan hydrolase)
VPKGTKLKVSRQDDPSRFVIVTVNDYGPDRKKHPERAIDLDKVAFTKIGNPRGGVLAVTVEVVPPPPTVSVATQRKT